MATPLTHILLADKIYEEHFGDCEKRDFMLGTILPDIRYLDKSISRESMHTQDVSLQDVKLAPTDFEKGKFFHSLVDKVRDEFYTSRGIYVRGGDEDFILALKLLEDQYLFSKLPDRSEYIQFLGTIPYDKVPSINKINLKKRYTIIRDEIVAGPNDSSRFQFWVELGTTGLRPNNINTLIHTLQKDKKILHLIDELYDSFGSLIRK